MQEEENGAWTPEVGRPVDLQTPNLSRAGILKLFCFAEVFNDSQRMKIGDSSTVDVSDGSEEIVIVVSPFISAISGPAASGKSVFLF